ncbi:MAG TPA: heavy metal translocating P-type ATPase [Opitutaceae bacterium]
MSACGCSHDHDEHDGLERGHDQAHACEHATAGGLGAETISLALAGVLVAAGLGIQWTQAVGTAVTRPLFFAAVAAAGWFLLPGSWRALRRLRPDINLLVVIATVGAAIIGEWAEAAMVVFLFGVAEWLEGWADRRAHRAVRALLELSPETARVETASGTVDTLVAEVAIGAVVLVRSGERIPLDGTIVAGRSTVNQAPITGEAVPVAKEPGDAVFAGTINGEGSLDVRVTKATEDTTLARIIRLVEDAQAQRAPTQRFVDRFARVYTPAVTAGAVLVFLAPPLLFDGDWRVWLYRACVLLIIACPCALVISTPVTIVAGLTALARSGVLVKGGAHLETIGSLRALAMDKTGTLTEGRPRVQQVENLAADEREILATAAAIDAHSNHPLAQAVVAHARERGVTVARADGYRAVAGRGAEAVVAGRRCFVGNHRFAHELGVCSPALEHRLESMEERGLSVVVVGEKAEAARDGRVLGVIAIGDTLRPGAREAVAALHAIGVRQIVMLSGDNQRTVDAIAREAGIDRARGDLLPEEKVGAVQALRAERGLVGMVGDGVNDAPAMAAASVGIAMGAAGTDAAIETADIALMQDDLRQIATAIRAGRRVLAIMRFNIAFALGLKVFFLALALLGYSSLWLAILADTGATLLVVANALRLLRSGR